MNPKYLVFGGFIISKKDGQTHYIPARRVMELYKVDRKDCMLVDGPNDLRVISIRKAEQYNPRRKRAIELWPDPRGYYQLPLGVFQRVPDEERINNG